MSAWKRATAGMLGAAMLLVALAGQGACELATPAAPADSGSGVPSGTRSATGIPLTLTGTAARLDPGEATQMFREANAYYAEGRYDEAATLYERIVAGGFVNADVTYNLGNAQYKAGRIGRAVLAYERTLKIDPGHDDARANLEFLREILPDRQTAVGGPTSRVFERVYARVTVDRAAALASVLTFALAAALILIVQRRFQGAWLSRVAVTVGAALVIVLFVIGVKVAQARAKSDGVIVETEVGVRTGPADDFVLEFKLHEGTKVRSREVRGDWTRVSVAGTDLEGWMPSRAVEEI
jgi:Flp pilus assembly protein TadD